MSQPYSTDPAELVEAVRSLPAARGFVAPPASSAEVDALNAELPAPLPSDVRQLLLLSNGIGVAGTSGFYLASVAGLRRFAADELYTGAFPGGLPIGDDGAQGLYVVDTAGRVSGSAGAVLLTDRGSFLPEDTVVAGPSASAVISRILEGEDLWQLPRMKPR